MSDRFVSPWLTEDARDRSNRNLECASSHRKEIAKQIKYALEGGFAGQRKVILGVQRLEPSTRDR